MHEKIMILLTVLLVSMLASTVFGELQIDNMIQSLDVFEPQAEVQAIAGLFDGCYSDAEDSLTAGQNYHQRLDKNTNALCVSICMEEGYGIAATQGADCYCSNSLPVPLLHESYEIKSAGNGGPCSTKCSGAFTTLPCKGDECCGGDSAYSVYIVGEIDVVKQLIDRIVANFQVDEDRVNNNILTAAEMNSLNCQCFNGEISIIIKSTNLDSNGERQLKTVKVDFINGIPTEAEEIEAVEGQQETELILRSLQRLLESEEPIKEEPFANFDVLCDNYFGDGDLVCRKIFSETIGSEETFTTTHGVNIGVKIGLEVENNYIYAKSKKTFELSVGYSFTHGYSSTTSESKTEEFTMTTSAKTGTKIEVRFFKSDQPLKVKWRARFHADGEVLIRYGGTFEKMVDLSRVLTYDQRELYAFGTIDYGERPTMIARTKTVDRDGNIIAVNDEEIKQQGHSISGNN